MHLIFYTSESTLADEEVEAALADIVQTCTRNNAELGITGVLLYENHHFLQALEGDEDVLRKTLKLIKQDPRHTNVTTLVDQPIESRSFSDWAMDTFFVQYPELVDSKLIALIHRLYEHSFEVNTRDLVEFHKRMID